MKVLWWNWFSCKIDHTISTNNSHSSILGRVLEGKKKKKNLALVCASWAMYVYILDKFCQGTLWWVHSKMWGQTWLGPCPRTLILICLHPKTLPYTYSHWALTLTRTKVGLEHQVSCESLPCSSLVFLYVNTSNIVPCLIQM